MRRVAAVFVAAMLVAVIPAAPVAADETIVVPGGLFGESSTTLETYQCPGAETLPYDLDRDVEPGPGTPPSGAHSVAFEVETNWSVVADIFVWPVATETEVGLWLHAPSGVTGEVSVSFHPQTASGYPEETWVASTSMDEPPGGWRAVDLAHTVFENWQLYDADGHLVGEAGPATAPERAAAYEEVSFGNYVVRFGCESNRFNVDAFFEGSPGDVVTMDFERATTTTLRIPHAEHTITAGETTTVAGRPVTNTDWPLVGVPVTLETRRFGSDSFLPQETVSSGPTSWGATTVAAELSPMRHVYYRWRLPTLGPEAEPSPCACEGSVSPTWTITVRTAVSAKLADRSIDAGGPLVVTGRTRPAKPGSTVKLWRARPGSDERWGTGVVRPTGRYRIAAPSGRPGTWRLYVTVPRGDGNLRGTSPIRRVSVSG
jgi:hypothetical protein